MVTNLAGSLAEKYPDASESELAAMAQDYFVSLAQAVTGGTTPETDTKGKKGEIDWSEFI